MSMNCTASANHADVSTTLVTGPPVAFGLAVKTTKGQARKFLSIAGSSSTDMLSVGMNVSAADGHVNIYLASSSPSNSGQTLSVALTDNVWGRPVVSFNTTNSRDVWVDGANKVSASGIINPVSLSQWILSGRPGDHTQNIGGLAAHAWMCCGVLLDNVEKQFLGFGGHPFGTNATDYWKLNRVSSGSIPNEYSGRLALIVTGTFTLGADDPNSATWYIGGNIGNQSWNQNQAISTFNVSNNFDNVNSAFTLALMKIAAAQTSATTTTNAGTNARVVNLTDITGINPGDYVKLGTNAQVRVNDVISSGTGVTGTILIRDKQTWTSSATCALFKVASASVTGVTFANTIGGTPTGTQAVTAGYFMRATCTADPTNSRLQQDSNTFSITVSAIPVAPTYSVVPAVTTLQTDGASIQFTPNTTCTAYALALPYGTAQPTAATIKAQASGLAHASKAVTSQDSLILTGIDFPIFDIWTVLNNNLGDSAVFGIQGVVKSPPLQKVYRTFTSLDVGTRYAGNCQVGDIEETDLRVIPANADVTYFNDGNESFTATGRQMRVTRTYSKANKAWILDNAGQSLSNVWYNDVAPVFTGAGSYFIIKLNTPVNINLRNLFTSIDLLTITAVDPLPTGLSIVNGSITGQVSANSNGSYSILATDVATVSTLGKIGLVAGTIKTPRLIFLALSDALAVLLNDHLKATTVEQDDDGPPGIVLGQDPVYLIDVNPGDTITLTVSKTPLGRAPYYGLRNHSFQVTPQADGDLDLGDPTGV
jgi:hypothetical protein